jgi:hypothetical protein
MIGEAGERPALWRNCDPHDAVSQDDRLNLCFHMPRGKEVEMAIGA